MPESTSHYPDEEAPLNEIDRDRLVEKLQDPSLESHARWALIYEWQKENGVRHHNDAHAGELYRDAGFIAEAIKKYQDAASQAHQMADPLLETYIAILAELRAQLAQETL